MPKYFFPKIEQVTIRNFSLYSKNDAIIEVNEQISPGVYCLAGANGLGKTTFLNAINYGLTGIVLGPDREVQVPHEIARGNSRFTDRYFQGRIKEKDKKSAEIEIVMRVNENYYRLVRGFFEKDSLRGLEIYRKQDSRVVSQIETHESTPRQLNDLYKQSIAKDIGINNFDYFAFLQLYVLTFDENRRMIFWDDKGSSTTLSIAFNTSQKDSEEVIDLKRRMDKYESDGRNDRWQATQVKNKMNNLLNTRNGLSDGDSESTQTYLELCKFLDGLEREQGNVKFEYDTFLKKQSYLNVDIFELKLALAKYFTQYSEPRTKLTNNTYIEMSLKKNECIVCGAHGSHVVEKIAANLRKDFCPLCSTAIVDESKVEQQALLEQIKNADGLVAQKTAELHGIVDETSAKKIELEKITFEVDRTKEKLTAIESENPTISLGVGKKDSLDVVMTRYQEQFDEFDRRSIENYAKRDKLRPAYEILQQKIEGAYKEAELEFVPVFQQLAKSFIGYDLTVSFSTKSRTMMLVLELEKNARTESSHLSESQRFFLDIALRMALAIHLSATGHEATMIIDTPEGSLDIAYESRVGRMFAEYVTDYSQNILMTANINASRLLVVLAENCKKSKMQFKRMLDWTDPSPIQRAGEDLFNEVYGSIETALGR